MPGKELMVWKLCTLMILPGLFLHCSEDDTPSIGADFIDRSIFDLIALDTITFKMSTVYSDSLATNGSTRLLVGDYADAFLGKVKSRAFFEVSIDDRDYLLDEQSTRYDSITLSMVYDGYYFNDTTTVQEVVVYRLTERMETEDGVLLRNTVIDHASIPLGTKEFVPKPLSRDTLEITLDHSLGLALYERSLDDDLFFENADDFKEFFSGMVIELTGEGNAMLGFDLDPELRVYYRNYKEIPYTQEYLVYKGGPATNTDLYFNQIETNWETGMLHGFDGAGTTLTSATTNQLSALMGSVGLSIRLEFPYLYRLKEDHPYLLIESALLHLEPEISDHESHKTLPDRLPLFKVTEDNEPYALLTEEASLNRDHEFNRENSYTVDITEFVQEKLGALDDNGNGLLLRLPDSAYRSTVDQVVLADPDNPKYNTYFQLTLINLTNE